MQALCSWRPAGGFHFEKSPDSGEDAGPVVHIGRHRTTLAVLDGLGGSGSFVPSSAFNTLARSHAALASSAVGCTLTEFIEKTGDLSALGDESWGAMAREIHGVLDELDELLGRERSAISSRLIHVLPTTLALATIEVPSRGDEYVDIDCIWAGDSRVYLLSPDETIGLCQISTDDTAGDTDAFQALESEPRMTNVLSLASRVVLHRRRFAASWPFVAISATDGCFDYFASPMHFEMVLLDSIAKARDFDSLIALLRDEISLVARDDATIALAPVGFDSWKQVSDAFLKRHASLSAQFLPARLDALNSADPDPLSGLWEEYRPSYERIQDQFPMTEIVWEVELPTESNPVDPPATHDHIDSFATPVSSNQKPVADRSQAVTASEDARVAQGRPVDADTARIGSRPLHGRSKRKKALAKDGESLDQMLGESAPRDGR